MLLHPDTARISVQKLHPIAHREYFLNRQVNSVDQSSLNSNYPTTQDNNMSNDTDDLSVGDINEITFSVLIDDGAMDEDVGPDDDDVEDSYDEDETEQEESDEEKRVCLFFSPVLFFSFSFRSVQSVVAIRVKLFII